MSSSHHQLFTTVNGNQIHRERKRGSHRQREEHNKKKKNGKLWTNLAEALRFLVVTFALGVVIVVVVVAAPPVSPPAAAPPPPGWNTCQTPR